MTIYYADSFYIKLGGLYHYPNHAIIYVDTVPYVSLTIIMCFIGTCSNEGFRIYGEFIFEMLFKQYIARVRKYLEWIWYKGTTLYEIVVYDYEYIRYV